MFLMIDIKYINFYLEFKIELNQKKISKLL